MAKPQRDKSDERDAYFHNKGQEDAAEGKYDLPNNVLGGFFNSSSEARENQQYRDGWRNTEDQKEASSKK